MPVGWKWTGWNILMTPTQDQLAFRGSPSISGALLRRVSLGTVFTSLKSRAATLSKIGADGQWLQVQAPEGDQGYVAAWYVSNADAPAPVVTPTSQPAPTPSGFIVKAIEDQLAFRSQPVVARFPIGSMLTVTDPDASQKIGVMNQWLKVKDAGGREGYVAAWYVSR